MIKGSFDNISRTLERQERLFDAVPILLAAAVALLLLQVWMRRSGREIPRISIKFSRFKFPVFTPSRMGTRVRGAEKQKETPASSGAMPEEPEHEDISTALKRAKRR